MTAVVLIAAIAGAARYHRGHHSSATAGPAPTTTAPATAVTSPPAPGTKVLSEPVDPAQIAVPDGWQTISTDPRTLAGALRALEPGHPDMAAVLRSQEAVASQGGIRLFAFTATGPLMFASVASSAVPGNRRLDPQALPAYPHTMTRSRGTEVDVDAIALPVGAAIRVRTITSIKTAHVACEISGVPIDGRAIGLVLCTEDAAVPALFAQIELSLRAG